MGFSFLNAELIAFLTIMLIYTKYRQNKHLALSLVEKLTVYLPPDQKDFETLSRTNTQARESKTGKKNKYDEKHLAKHAKFPMRTMEIEE
jgi:hypothetical protein